MRSLLLSLLLIISIPCSATTRSEAVEIYNHIVQESGISNAPPIAFSDSKVVNASANPFMILVNQGMLNFTNRDEMALVLGHELGHWKLHHRGSTHANEFAADALGWYLAQKAGYNVCKGKKFFLRIPRIRSKTHPFPLDRYNRLPSCGK